MKKIVEGVILKDSVPVKKPPRKNPAKKLTPRQEKMKELVAEGYSPEKAMELAGYSPNTIKGHLSEYRNKISDPELWNVFKRKSVERGMEALDILGGELHGEKSSDRIRSGDSLLRNVKTVAKDGPSEPVINFHFQTIDKAILLNARGQADSDDQDELCIDGEAEDKD
jgi:hypothetical protein